MEIFLSVFSSVVGNVIAYYVIKWLDKKIFGNQPEE